MVFCFVQNFFFRTTQELEYFVFCPELNIRLYDKNSESDYFFFPPPKSEYFFQQLWESEYFFRKKTITPPLQVKWSFPYGDLFWNSSDNLIGFRNLAWALKISDNNNNLATLYWSEATEPLNWASCINMF